MVFDYFDLLSGEPIPYHDVGHLRSPMIKELFPSSGIGLEAYNFYLNLLAWDKEKLLKYGEAVYPKIIDKLRQNERLNAFDIATLLPSTRSFYKEVFEFFMVENVVWHDKPRKYVAYTTDDDGQHITGEINRDNFDRVRHAMLQLNFISLDNDEAKEPVHTSEHAKELWDKAQGFLKAQKDNSTHEDRPELNMGNIISKLCATNIGYNYFNVFQLTVFQLYDAFFQYSFLRSADLNENIFSNHGGDKFKFEDWTKPILRQV